jgi:hypothetical protein
MMLMKPPTQCWVTRKTMATEEEGVREPPTQMYQFQQLLRNIRKAEEGGDRGHKRQRDDRLDVGKCIECGRFVCGSGGGGGGGDSDDDDSYEGVYECAQPRHGPVHPLVCGLCIASCDRCCEPCCPGCLAETIQGEGLCEECRTKDNKEK